MKYYVLVLVPLSEKQFACLVSHFLEFLRRSNAIVTIQLCFSFVELFSDRR